MNKTHKSTAVNSFAKNLSDFLNTEKLTITAASEHTGITYRRLLCYLRSGMSLFIEDAIRLLFTFQNSLSIPIISSMVGVDFPKGSAYPQFSPQASNNSVTSTNQEFTDLINYAESQTQSKYDFIAVRIAIASQYTAFSERYGKDQRMISAIDYGCIIRVLRALKKTTNSTLAQNTRMHINTVNNHLTGKSRIQRFDDAVLYDQAMNAHGLLFSLLCINSASEIYPRFSFTTKIKTK